MFGHLPVPILFSRSSAARDCVRDSVPPQGSMVRAHGARPRGVSSRAKYVLFQLVNSGGLIERIAAWQYNRNTVRTYIDRSGRPIVEEELGEFLQGYHFIVK